MKLKLFSMERIADLLCLVGEDEDESGYFDSGLSCGRKSSAEKFGDGMGWRRYLRESGDGWIDGSIGWDDGIEDVDLSVSADVIGFLPLWRNGSFCIVQLRFHPRSPWIFQML